MEWTPYYEPGQKEAPVEIFDIIRAAGGFVDAIHNTPEQAIVCIISDEVDLPSLDPKWKVAEVSIKRLMNLLKSRDPQVFLMPSGYPRFPNEELTYQFIGVGVEYI
jgi:hypothetical protein